jgi:lipopolysaccharide export system permease protein
MALLLASIMTYGNLGEKFELVALKAAGIPLKRMLISIGAVAVFFSATDFIILNQLSPVLTLKWVALYFDIHNQKPAFDLQEGIFYRGLEGYAIKVGKKDTDGKTIHNVIIYDRSKKRGNTHVITALEGKVEKSKDERFLFFTLYDGRSYEELKDNENYQKTLVHNTMQFDT